MGAIGGIGAGEGAALLAVAAADLPRLMALVDGRIAFTLLDDPGRLSVGDLTIDLAARQVRRAGRTLALHPREIAVLIHFARHCGDVVTRADLYRAVWGRDFDPGTNVVAVTLSRLRAKLDRPGAPPLIRTVPGGYRLVETIAAG